MANGIVLCGSVESLDNRIASLLIASSPAVARASKPINEKNTAAEPASVPEKPKGKNLGKVML